MIETQDLLFELGTEELPPTALKELAQSLSAEFAAGLAGAGLEYSEIHSFATPRRLAIVAESCAIRQQDREIRRRGPAVQAAFDDDGNPTKAAEGFARSCDTTVERLEREKTDKGEWLSCNIRQAGESASGLLPEIADKALSRLPIPKRMRWSNGKDRFVRPVHWLVLMQGSRVIDCELMGVRAGRQSHGHRFHHPQAITINHPSEYADRLVTGRVIADLATRRQHIHEQVQAAASALGGQVDVDDALLDEVAALVEWPIPIVAGFEEKYLEVPDEILIHTMKKNQKYFPVVNRDGGLMNQFIAIANIDSRNPDVIRDGNERVIRPRLADAMFFWEQDGRKRLEDHLEATKSVVFQQKLGSMYDKSRRVAGLAAIIAADTGADVQLAKRAGLLSRCDLMTATVGEFAEMQGIMGRYQAHRDNEPEELALAMDEFYMPRFSGDRLPATATGIAISLAEKTDTLVGIFGVGMKPTGDKDPFALRRAALGTLRILQEHRLNIDLHHLLEQAVSQFGDSLENDNAATEVYDFMMNRLKGMYSENGVSVGVFTAVASRRPGNIADFDRCLHAVIGFQQLPEAEALAIANKRISNILKKAGDRPLPEPDPELFQQLEESRLNDQIQTMSEQISSSLSQGDYEATLKDLATLREPVDAFFDHVMVMTDDEAIKTNRLALLARLQHLFLQVADISHLT